MRILETSRLTEKGRDSLWQKMLQRSFWFQEMGAYLIMSKRVSRTDKIALNLNLDAIDNMRRENKADGNWEGATRDMAMIQMDSRFNAINRLTSRYPIIMRQFKTVMRRAHRKEPSLPRTTFRHRWHKTYRNALIKRFYDKFTHHERW